MTFARLNRGDWIAWVAALVLVVSVALDWYGTALGDEARTIEESAQPAGAVAGEAGRKLRDEAREVAEREERNALDPAGVVDAVILVLILGSAGLAFAAGFTRAADRRFEPPASPSGFATVAATALAVLIAYRMIQEPGLDSATTIKFGALLGLLAAAGVALGASRALKAEQEGTAWAAADAQASKAASRAEARRAAARSLETNEGDG